MYRLRLVRMIICLLLGTYKITGKHSFIKFLVYFVKFPGNIFVVHSELSVSKTIMKGVFFKYITIDPKALLQSYLIYRLVSAIKSKRSNPPYGYRSLIMPHIWICLHRHF